MAKREIEPRLFALIRGAYENIAKEMAIALERSTWSPVLSMGRDFSTIIADSEFNLVAVPEEILPGQAVSLQRFAKNMAGFFEGDISDGDVLLSNMAYYGSLHAAEIGVARPVFYDGKIMFWTVARGHLLDIGSPAPTSIWPYAKDLYCEGLKVPPVKIYEAGKPRKDVLELYLANLRFRAISHGDLMAHIASTAVGRDRLIKLIDKYSPETLNIYTQELFDYTDRMVGAEIRKMKQGTYYGEDWIDTNSFGARNIPVRAKITIKDDMFIVDLSDNVPQIVGGINCTLDGMTSGTVYSFLGYCVDPQIPKNQGLIRHCKIICPPGTILSATEPFSTQQATTASGEILYRSLFRALAAVCPEIAVAGIAQVRASWYASIDYRDERNAPWMMMETNEGGGGGGACGADGSACMLDFEVVGGQKYISNEMLEWLYPIIVEINEIAPNSHGAGKYRGAPGTHWKIKPYECSTVHVATIGAGQQTGPYGLLGGKPGAGAVCFKCDPREPEKGREFFDICVTFALEPGQVHEVFSSGGGGYGDPLERDPELVRIDVRDEIESVDRAREDYGVVLDPQTYEIDYKATEKLRNKIRRERGELPLVSPTEPSAISLMDKMMTEKDKYVNLDRSPGEI